MNHGYGEESQLYDTDASKEALNNLNIEYIELENGRLLTRGGIDFRDRNLNTLPDLRAVIVSGGFHCGHNNLKTLEGSPQIIRGGFSCAHNPLISLKGKPLDVGGGFALV